MRKSTATILSALIVMDSCLATLRSIVTIAVCIFILDTTASTGQSGRVLKSLRTIARGATSISRSTGTYSSAACAFTLCIRIAVLSTAHALMDGINVEILELKGQRNLRVLLQLLHRQAKRTS